MSLGHMLEIKYFDNRSVVLLKCVEKLFDTPFFRLIPVSLKVGWTYDLLISNRM